MNYPDRTIQRIVLGAKNNDWWVKEEGSELCPGLLVRAHFIHFDVTPHYLVFDDRSDAKSHQKALYRIVAGDIKKRAPEGSTLPIAGATLFKGEARMFHKSKARPAVVVSLGGGAVEARLARGQATWQRQRYFIAAPFYSADSDGERTGYSPEFVARVQQGEYPQFVWDHLPHRKGRSSIARFDQMQPVGLAKESWESLGFRLSDDALDVFHEQIKWFIEGDLDADGLLADVKTELSAMP